LPAWALARPAASLAVALERVIMGFLALPALGWRVRAGARDAAPTVVLVAASPWWWVATTSRGDSVRAVAAVLGGAVAARRDARVLAGVAFGLAVGLRASSIALAAAWLAAEVLGRRDTRPWRAVVGPGATP